MATSSSTLCWDDTPSQRTGLPLSPEILELIFWQMDPSTFFIALQTCRQFAEAGSTRKNLLNHISQIPGGYDCWRSNERGSYPMERHLFDHCCRHAARSGCMAWVLADVRKSKLSLGVLPSKAAFTTHHGNHRISSTRPKRSHLALASDRGTITIYSLAIHDITPTLTLDLVGPSNSQQPTTVHALAFSSEGDLVVMHSQGTQTFRTGKKDEHPIIGTDLDLDASASSDPLEVYELTTFFRCNNDDPVNPTTYRKQPRRIQIYGTPGAKPIGIALSRSGNISVAWRERIIDNLHKCTVHLIGVLSKSEEIIDVWDGRGVDYPKQRFPMRGFDITPDESCGSTINMKFIEHESRFLISRGSMPLYHYFARSGRNDQPSSNTIYNPSSNDVSFSLSPPQSKHVRYDSFRIGMPFYRHHNPAHPKHIRARTPCYSDYLCLAILDIRPSLLTTGPHLYLLSTRDDSPPQDCRKLKNLDHHHRFDSDWAPVALLAGWRASHSTVGSVLEPSPGGTRIAAADWDRILVWTLDPRLLCEEYHVRQSYFPARDWNEESCVGRLRPVLLPGEGVVHQMKWLDESTLFAVTDRGLVSWDVGARASGKRLLEGRGEEGGSQKRKRS